MKHFITYGDSKFEKAKNRILTEAKITGWFDTVKAYSDCDISEDLRDTGLMEIPRGGGVWSWKPDIIYKTLQNLPDGDIIVYADSGCSIQKCREWNNIAEILKNKDLIAQKILQPTVKWTRREIIDAFKDNPKDWTKQCQFCATIIIKITPFTRKFIREWRQSILDNPIWIQDVSEADMASQLPGFFENRHDQAVYSALVYKYLNSGHIHTQWERIENFDIFKKQAIRATRLRNGEQESKLSLCKKLVKRIIYAYFVYPLRNI